MSKISNRCRARNFSSLVLALLPSSAIKPTAACCLRFRNQPVKVGCIFRFKPDLRSIRMNSVRQLNNGLKNRRRFVTVPRSYFGHPTKGAVCADKGLVLEFFHAISMDVSNCNCRASVARVRD